MMKLATKELTTANGLVNESESEDEAVLFVIVTPVMLDEDLNQKIQSLNNKQHLMSFINNRLENLLKINQQKHLLKLILCIFLKLEKEAVVNHIY